jgi:hypothetical protein
VKFTKIAESELRAAVAAGIDKGVSADSESVVRMADEVLDVLARRGIVGAIPRADAKDAVLTADGNWVYPFTAVCRGCKLKLTFDVDPGGTPGRNGDWGAEGDYGCSAACGPDPDDGCGGHDPHKIRWTGPRGLD